MLQRALLRRHRHRATHVDKAIAAARGVKKESGLGAAAGEKEKEREREGEGEFFVFVLILVLVPVPVSCSFRVLLFSSPQTAARVSHLEAELVRALQKNCHCVCGYSSTAFEYHNPGFQTVVCPGFPRVLEYCSTVFVHET